MGWLTMHREKGTSNKDFFEREFPSIEMLDCATKGGVFYAAARRRDNHDVVFGLVFLTQWAPNDHYNFGYKDMDETMGPVEDDCPKRILDLLTPTDSEWANGWRERSYAKAAKMERAKVVKKGVKVRFKNSVEFTNGTKQDTFTFVRNTCFRSEYGYEVRISRWKTREFEVVA